MRRVLFQPWPHHPLHPLVVAPSPRDPTGRWGPTPGVARGPTQRRVAAGWYSPVEVDPDLTDQRIAEAAVRLTDHGAVTGWAALHWRGARWFDGTGPGGTALPVTLAIAGGCVRPAPGIQLSKERLRPDDIEVVDGLRVTTAARSVLFEMRYAADLARAVAHLDMAAISDLVSLDEASAYAEELSGWTGIPLAREAIALGDENAWSPMEVHPRIAWTLHPGLGRPLTNRPLFSTTGRHLLTPDLIDPVAGVVGQYDGDVHLTRAAKGRDVERDALCRDLGLEQVVMTAGDLPDPSAFLRRLVAAHDRAAARPAGPSRWTLDPPHWWGPTTTVEERRALSPADRVRLLGHLAPRSA